MFAASMLWMVSTLAGQPAAATDQTWPKEWPPLPDFKTTVDYVTWWEDYLNQGATDDAWPLWAKIVDADDDPDPVRQTKARLWGEENGLLPGLLTGEDDPPARYAWIPEDHPKWEAGYQSRKAGALHEKLAEIAKYKHVRYRPVLDDYFARELESGLRLTDQDRLLLAYSFPIPHLVMYRQAVKALLQDGWRAPGGRIDPDTMLQAIEVSFRISRQAAYHNRFALGHLVNIAGKQLVYLSIIRALNERVFDKAYLLQLQRLLARHDREPIEWRGTEAGEIAHQLDMLQFPYLPPDGKWSNPPKLNEENYKKLAGLLKPIFTSAGSLPDAPDPAQLGDPVSGVAKYRDLQLELRQAGRRGRPQEIIARFERLSGGFLDDPETHAIFKATGDVSSAHLVMLSTRMSAERRAVRVLIGLHRYRDQHGKWPASLTAIRGWVSARVRTDPFSGKPFVCRVENGRPTLYSVGYNGKDDGGKHDPQWGRHLEDDEWIVKPTDYVFWPVPRRKP